MDFLKNIAWWVWLIIAGLLGVMGYGVYYYIKKKQLADVADSMEEGGANEAHESTSNDTPQKPPKTVDTGGEPVDAAFDEIKAGQEPLPIAAKGKSAVKAADVQAYIFKYNGKKPYQKSGQVQHLQLVLIGMKALPRGSDDGVLGAKTAAALKAVTKGKINLAAASVTGRDITSTLFAKPKMPLLPKELIGVK
jgi:hypothetical protein